MDSAAEKELCAICGTERLIFHRNFKKVKTKFSGTTVFQLLERFSERDLSHLTIDMYESGACNDCYAKLNDYDAAYTKALIIRQELTDLLQNGSLQIFQQPAEVEHDKAAKQKDNGRINWVPQLERSSELTNRKPTFSIAGMPAMRISMKCNVCGAIFNNISHMKQHSHDDVSEREQMPEKEARAPSPMLVIENVKTESTSVDNSDEELDVYLEYRKMELYPKEEAESEEYYLSEGKEEQETAEASHQSQQRTGPFECLYCEAKFENKLCLREHFKTNHPQNDAENICKVCGFATKTRAALASHYGKHLRESELVCQVCSKKFTQRASLQRHMAIHTGEKPYQCDVCGKQFIHYSSFYMHRLAHKNVRSKNCTICGYSLRSNSHLIRHMRTHSGEKPYACPVCDQKFSQRYNMVQHQKTHSGIMRRSGKTFNCPYCDYTSARNALLKRHLMKHHGKSGNALSEKDAYDQMGQEETITDT
ncbi:zinc finger protein OZF-like [Anopheles stephensi]|uniref:zinc finger protein OZF-like n=1 Tax=Anopheles stephensi TaxID=30069 RepID=UPI001658930D|nr:zinc finger protein OZF-like [Anopheles stephensi]